MNSPLGKTSPRLIRIKEVIDRVGIGRSTIYDWMNPRSPRFDVTFPKPVKLGGNSIAWLEHDIDSWILGKVSV